ncbi:MAG: translation elongation factor Ts [Holosporales bacterium]
MISASDVKELRERTGAGMMDCKKALAENNGDMEAAVDWLRKKGLAAAAKKATRTAAEGLVGVVANGTVGAVVEVNAETDFVARNDKFQDYVRNVTQLALGIEGSIDALKAAKMPSGKTAEEEITELVSVIGENMNLRRNFRVSVSDGVVAAYVHNAIGGGLGRIGVLVGLESSADKAKLAELAKRIAMHAAAANPIALNIADVDPALVERERSIFKEQAIASGKPAEFAEKMVEGRVRKFFEEVVLSEQLFLLDDTKRKVSQVVEDAGKELGSAIKLAGFVLCKVGDGIEKEEKDFAAEVAEQLAK